MQTHQPTSSSGFITRIYHTGPLQLHLTGLTKSQYLGPTLLYFEQNPQPVPRRARQHQAPGPNIVFLFKKITTQAQHCVFVEKNPKPVPKHGQGGPGDTKRPGQNPSGTKNAIDRVQPTRARRDNPWPEIFSKKKKRIEIEEA